MEIKTTNFLLQNPYSSPNPDAKLLFIYPALQEFKKLKTPTKVAYNIVKSIGSVENAIKQCTETKTAICHSLCEKDGNGDPLVENGQYKFLKENISELNEKILDLMNSEISLTIFPVNQSDISDVKDMSIECYETLMRHGFIYDDTVQATKPILNGKSNKKELESIG